MKSQEIGIAAGHGASPGGTGRLFPDATLPTLGGGMLSLDGFRPRNDLVLLLLGDGPPGEQAMRLLEQLVGARTELAGEDGVVLALATGLPSAWGGAWPYDVPLLFDADSSVHRRAAAIDDAGRAETVLYLTDRYREIFAVLRPGDARWPASARDVVEWLTFMNIQCPECNPPER
jgi:hypothetical protein